MHQTRVLLPKHAVLLPELARGYDPELLMVECANCGQPVLWERGRSTEVLQAAGIDPIELDAHCLLLTDGCPRCRPKQDKAFTVQVFRVTPSLGGFLGAKSAGHS